ncbi:MAG: 4-(cytidine 5'-diphospho)-2-C-methyl-D-erythritol kinase [Dehalococcoidales bacterium]|nr:4-(cytidine 5'-diphospho)-2-C-methyl-D-erythritol kinase [Dehalococcoidales bacterium]
MMTILAPAKVNLTLEVLAKRQDGFHEIRSVIQTVNLCDSLSFKSGEKIEYKSDLPEWIAEKSLVSKAIILIRETTGCSRGATITVNKRIPLVAGLGGDSSDAAATLHGLNQLWGLHIARKELHGLASRLGSDVACFLYGGTTLIEGRGETVTSLPPLSPMWVVLVLPPVVRLEGKTKKLYDSLIPNHYTDGLITERLVKEIKAGKENICSLLFNTFENLAFIQFPGLAECREHIIRLGAENIHLAGSGPTLFSLFKEKVQAEELHIRLKQQNIESYLINTLPAIYNW